MVVMCLPQWLIHRLIPSISQTPHVQAVKRDYQAGYVEYYYKVMTQILFYNNHS